MPRIRILKSEIALCFDRFLIDAEDDFFPDPLRYKDLRLVRDQIVNETQRTLRATMNQNKITYTTKHHYPWYVPKENFVIREGCSFHPYDTMVFHFILNRLLPIIEPKLSKSRYSYRIKNTKSKKLFGYNPTENWITFKNDMRDYFANNPDYQFMVSTDIAGFFEYIPITIFKKRLLQMSSQNESQSIELLSFMLKEYSSSKYSGMPQNCDPFSYLCTAFLDF